MSLASRNGIQIFRLALFLIVFAVVCVGGYGIVGEINFITIVVALLLGLLIISSVHVVQQWERAVVMRLGRFKAVKGPGLYVTMPIIDYNTMIVDMRIRSTSFGAEETLSTDLVPLDVDAVLFWMVHDAEKACTVVEDYSRQVLLSAQTILRDAIGRATAAEVTSRREQLDRELKRLLEDKVAPWGISIQSVEVRDILLPSELQDVMSLEAQAEQQKKARLILMEAEAGIQEIIGDVADAYGDDEKALEFRKMHLLYEGIKDGKGTVVIPSSWSDAFGGAPRKPTDDL